MPIRVVQVVDSRASCLQVASILRAMHRTPDFAPRWIHVGHEDDASLSPEFIAELGLPAPDRYLGVSADSPTVETARILIALEQVLLADRPDLLLVVGDGNATFAGALAAVKLRIPVAHVEAGLRSGEPALPEELNRHLTDRISAWLFTPSPDAEQNLLAEGHPPAHIHPVGNVRIDSLLQHRSEAARSQILDALALEPRSYAVLTLDRREILHDPAALATTLHALTEIPAEIPILFPVDPRYRRSLPAQGERLRILDPLGYRDSLQLMAQARFVLTDSGGVAEEATALEVPCLTLRDETARPTTVTEGTNFLVGLDPVRIAAESRKILRGEGKLGRSPATWNGKAAERIVSVLTAGAPAWSLDEALSEP